MRSSRARRYSAAVHDICAVGHVTRDRVRIGEDERDQPGGSAWYLGLALRCLGRNTAVVTRLAARDEALLAELEAAGARLHRIHGPRTTVFENTYVGGDPDQRVQRVEAVAEPFEAEDLGDLRARAFHLGPLTSEDMSAEFVAAVSARGPVWLDLQGLVRRVTGHEISNGPWPGLEEALQHTAVAKADDAEAALLTGEADPERAAARLEGMLGVAPREAVVTLGRRGSLIRAGGRLHRVATVPARQVVDATGCGDTWLAAYLHRRLASDDVAAAGAFASAASTLALERRGPLAATAAEVAAAVQRLPG